MLGGDEYPSTAIGINLPNADWIRAEHGSKSVTIGNLTDAYNKAARGNGFDKEFVIDEPTRSIIDKYGDLCDDLHTDLHVLPLYLIQNVFFVSQLLPDASDTIQASVSQNQSL